MLICAEEKAVFAWIRSLALTLKKRCSGRSDPLALLYLGYLINLALLMDYLPSFPWILWNVQMIEIVGSEMNTSLGMLQCSNQQPPPSSLISAFPLTVSLRHSRHLLVI